MFSKFVPNRWRWGAVGVALAMVAVAVLGVLTLNSGDEAKAQPIQFHGITIQKVCEGPSKVGDTTECLIRIANADDFGDTIEVHEAWDVQDAGDDAVRVPAVGDLPIASVDGNALCAPGPALPCLIGAPGSTLSGLPGDPVEGSVTFLSNEYVVQPGDADPLTDQGNVVWHDHCDAPGTVGCADVFNTAQAPASINLVQPAIAVDKTGDAFSKLGDDIDYTVTLSNNSSTDTPPLDCTATDSLAGVIYGPAILPPGDTVVNYTMPAPAGPDPLVNTVDLTCTVEGLGNVLTASDSHEVDLVHPDFTIAKTCSPDPVSVDGTITWEVTLANTGDVTLIIVVSDPTAGISETVTLAAGATQTITRSRTVTAADAPAISNTATASATLDPALGLDNVIGPKEASDSCAVEVPVEGRMTGGGSVFRIDGARVTRGFEIHCDLREPNNIEVNWPGGNNFHMDTLTAAVCTDDPAIIQNPPAAPFDTFTGDGTGKLNGVPGATIHFVFVDAGEPGKNDTALIHIWDADGNLVLEVSGFIDVGNLQAHKD